MQADLFLDELDHAFHVIEIKAFVCADMVYRAMPGNYLAGIVGSFLENPDNESALVRFHAFHRLLRLISML